VLPNGYLINRDKAAQTRIVKRSGGVVVAGPIAGYGVYRDVVAGNVGPVVTPGSGNVAPPADQSRSYFVLDTASGKLDTNLDAMAWNKRLKELGAPTSPEISPPVLPE
jgi:hypothetical protein